MRNFAQSHTENDDLILRLFHFQPCPFSVEQKPCLQAWFNPVTLGRGCISQRGNSENDSSSFFASPGFEKCQDRETFLVFVFRANH